MCTKRFKVFFKKEEESLLAVAIGMFLSIPLRFFLDMLIFKLEKLWLYFIVGLFLILLSTAAGFGILATFWKFKRKEKISKKYFFVIEWTICICLSLLLLL